MNQPVVDSLIQAFINPSVYNGKRYINLHDIAALELLPTQPLINILTDVFDQIVLFIQSHPDYNSDYSDINIIYVNHGFYDRVSNTERGRAIGDHLTELTAEILGHSMYIDDTLYFL